MREVLWLNQVIRLLYYLPMERMKKPKFIKEIEKSEWKERAKCWRWYIRVYWELDNKPMVELESLEIIVKELHKLEEENKKLKEKIKRLEFDVDAWHQLKLLLEWEIEKLKEYNWELIENHKKDIAILCEENEKLREELSAYDREFRDEDKKAKNIYISQKENILMWKIC